MFVPPLCPEVPEKACPEYWFLHSNYLSQIVPKVRETPIENLASLVLEISLNGEIKEFHGNIIVRDGKNLIKSASEEDYKRLEERLVSYLGTYTSGRPATLGINYIIDVVASTLLDYLDLLQKKFGDDIDPEKIRRLRIAGIEAIEGRKDDFSNKWLILLNLPPILKELYQQLEAERRAALAAGTPS